MPLFILLAAGAFGAMAATTLILSAFAVLNALSTRRRRLRIEQDGADAVEAWTHPIPVIVPERAPRNGTPWGDEDTPTHHR